MVYMNKMKYPFLIILFLLLSTSIGFSAERGLRIMEKRLALVIGNADYKNSPLKNPVNDARDISNILKKLNFEVIYKENANLRVFEKAVRDFGKRLRQTGEIGLFYYAGHGVQVKDGNYLIPIDAQIYEETDIKYEAIHAGRILDAMHNASNRMNIVILDACRDNPFARSFRSSVKGLARMDAPTGTLIAYATSPGNVAADGDGRNSFYTKHLLRQMPDPSLNIEKVFKNVRVSVIQETGNRQVPWESSSLTGDFYFNPRKRISPKPSYEPPTPVEPPSAEDFERYDSVIQERRKMRKKWAAWQTAMSEHFAKAEQYDSSPDLVAQEKADVWATFLKLYKPNNPYSLSDDEFRKTALSKKMYWETRLSESGKMLEGPAENQAPAEPARNQAPAEPVIPRKPAEPVKQTLVDLHETSTTREENQHVKKIVILPFYDVKVGKRKDVDIDLVFDLLKTYKNFSVESSYYQIEAVQVEKIDHAITSTDIDRIWSSEINSNIDAISKISKEFSADIVLLYKKVRKKEKLSWHATSSSDPSKHHKYVYTLTVYIVDVEKRKVHSASKQFSGGLFYNTGPIVRSITKTALDECLSTVDLPPDTGALSTEK